MGFDRIIGHERQKRLLLAMLERKNIAHAFLFCGQDGIGKKQVAREFVNYLFCETHSACGTCRACIKLTRGSHPDLIAIEGQGSIGIDRSRMLSKEIYEYPYESDRRAIIIDSAEKLTPEAANALLKTLEEPPPFNVFFLVTSAEKEIPLTIRSRCTRIFFTPLLKEQLKQYFVQHLYTDNKPASGEQVQERHAELLADISYGSIGCGLFWNEDDNLNLRRMVAELILGGGRNFVGASLITERIAATEGGFGMYLAFLLSLFRDLLVLKHTGDRGKLVNKDVEELLSRQGPDVRWVEDRLQRIQETTRVMRYNINRWLAFENLLFQVMR
ncbi:MAG TPA: DNA polymerase III subunit [Syntrophorhabdaceae bacterium]|nr:DNA polymerase III subunit [Syntrophorhabdaceae bacterium]